MKKACLFHFKSNKDFHGYQIDSLDPLPYFTANKHWNIYDVLKGGLSELSRSKQLLSAEKIDKLYRNKDPEYMNYIQDFVNKFIDYDLIVLSSYNPIHPEVLYHELKKPRKILGFIDDPYSTYGRGIPYLWAFDGAFYISPSYGYYGTFTEALERWGCNQHFWWPLACSSNDIIENVDIDYQERDIDLVYIGAGNDEKINRLITLKKHFGKKFHVYGRWNLNGYAGIARGLLGRPVYWERVKSLTNNERKSIYSKSKIGINFHLTEEPAETGNMRMYELPAHGVMMVCDKAAMNIHKNIFAPDKEAVYFDSINEAIDKIEYYVAHEQERLEIARNALTRTKKDYVSEIILLNFLNWACSLPKSV